MENKSNKSRRVSSKLGSIDLLNRLVLILIVPFALIISGLVMKWPRIEVMTLVMLYFAGIAVWIAFASAHNN